MVLLLVPLLNDLLGLGGEIRIPIPFGALFLGYLIFNVWNFENIAALGALGVLGLILACYLAAFTRKISFEDGAGLRYTFNYSVKADNIFHSSYGAMHKGRSDSAARGGMFLIELLVSMVSGPFFFAHGLYTLRKLSNYTETTTK